MNAFLSLAESYIRFAWWQSTILLVVALLAERWFRRAPWRRHMLLSNGIMFAALAPAGSILCQSMGFGMFPPEDEVSVTASLPDRMFLALGWLVTLGGILLALYILRGILVSHRLYSRAVPLSDPALQQLVREKAERIGRRTLPILFTSESVRSPMIWCWAVHPAVLFPPGMVESATREVREAIFLHELAHLHRFDHWVQFITTCCGCLLFWNPLYWAARRRADLFADQACDALALYHVPVNPSAFADAILALATKKQRAGALLFLSKKERIMERVGHILDFARSEHNGVPRRGLGWSCTIVGLFAVSTLLLAICQPAVIAAQPRWGGHTHLVVFTPVGDFHPQTPRELLDKLNKTLFQTNVRTGYFRTWPENDRLVGGICTNDPRGLANVIQKIPELKLVSTRPLTNRSFESHTKRRQESLVWTTPKGGYTHLTVFEPVGEFQPKSAGELLAKLNQTLQPSGVRTGYFRTWTEDGRPVGGICTDDPEGLKKVLDAIPELKWIETKTLDAASFGEYSGEKPTDSGDESSSAPYTHMAVFAPVGEFQPRTPVELLKKLNAKLFPAKIRTGYFRTAPAKGRLVGAICTDDPAGFKKVIETIPELELVSTEAVTAESFAKYVKRTQESLGWTTPEGGYVYLTVFKPVGDFHPKTPMELLNKLNAKLFPARVRTGYFRTWPEDGRLIGGICTDDAEGLENVLKDIPELERIRTDVLDEKSFAKHSKRAQQSLADAQN